MSLFVANGIELRTPQKNLLEKVSFEIPANQIIAVVGQNGSGKSSFLKVIAGVLDIDSGKTVLTKGVQIGYLPQDFELDENLSSLQTLEKYAKNTLELGLSNLNSDLEIEDKINAILIKFQIPNKLVKHLSGGQKRKLAIAQSLFLEPQILILDEPTNHLDIESVEIVENILKNYTKNGKSVILVSHDRYFLDNLANQFWEIQSGKIYQHNGKWSNYLENKQTRLQINRQTEDKKQAFLKREIQWVRAGVKARSTKDKGRLERFYDLESDKKFENEKSASFLLPPNLPLGNKILELHNVSLEIDSKTKTKSFGDKRSALDNNLENVSKENQQLEENLGYLSGNLEKEKLKTDLQTQIDLKNNSQTHSKPPKENEENYQNQSNLTKNPTQKQTQKIVKDLNFTFHPKTVLGIIGSNGSGKTSLISSILKQIPIQSGKIIIGQNTVFNYQDQNKLELNQDNSIFEELCQSSETLKWGENMISSRKYLKTLLFENEQIEAKIKNLSGGQKARIMLAKILKNGGNCLILDEPTNDLDIETINLLEKSIQNFQGICIVISHDRYFLNQVCTDILALLGNGKFVLSTGNYDDYLAKTKPQNDWQNDSFQIDSKSSAENSNKNNKNSWQENKNRQKDLQKIERLIEKSETEIAILEKEFENVNLYKENPDKYNQKAKKLENLKSELEQKLAEWEELS